jgi:hypothetical protein
VDAFNPTEIGAVDEVRFACEGDTDDTIYVGWDDEEFYRNATVKDDVAGDAILVQFGPRIVGEA